MINLDVFARSVRALSITLAGILAPLLRADCTLPPSVSVTLSGPDDNGNVVINIAYNFPDTTISGQRGLSLEAARANGGTLAMGGFSPSLASGVWQVPHNMSCEPSDSYTFRAKAVSCGQRITEGSSGLTYTNVPTVSASYSGPDQFGHGTMTIAYDFPHTSSASQRRIMHEVVNPNGGTGLATPPLDLSARTGTVTYPHDMTCQPSGTYTHKITAIQCGRFSAINTSSATVSGAPAVSVSADAPDENGDVLVTIGYSFPNTDSPGQRSLQSVTRNGNTTGVNGGLSPEQQSGTWQQTLNFACVTGERTLIATAISCGRDQRQATQSLTLAPAKPDVSVSLKKGNINPATGKRSVEATVSYDMGEGPRDWRLTAHVASWTTADGQTHPGSQLLSEIPTQRAGVRTITFDPPSNAQQLTVRANGSSCVGSSSADASIECDSCPLATKNPVYFADGNVRVPDGDTLPPVAGYTLARTYNSDEQIVGLFGRGWTTLFDRRAVVNIADGDTIVSLVSETNDVVTFRRGSGESAYRQTWPTSRASHGTLTYDSTSATYAFRAAGSNTIAVFRASDGWIVTLRDLGSGREAQIVRNAQGLPQTMTDSWTGTTWNLSIDSAARRVSSMAVAGWPDIVWNYAYDGAGNLTHVTAPGNNLWRTYEYVANRMTASYDASGHLLESHTYDANGYGTSSTGPEDEIVTIQYGLPGTDPQETITRVTYKTGATADYALRPFGGAHRPVQITGGCSQCGARDATYVYDRSGRPVREQHADGYVTVRTYDLVHLIAEEQFLRPSACDPATDAQHCRLSTDALALATLVPTGATIKTLYEFSDPKWPDRVTAIVTPSVRASGRQRRQDTTYHATTGTVAQSSVRGWTGTGEETVRVDRVSSLTFYGDGTRCDPEGDEECGESDLGLSPAFAPGGSFQASWLSLSQPTGRPKAVDGPRIDVPDVSTFVYYPIHSSVPARLRGQLAASKNGAGHIVRYDDYDVFGNATRIADANGVVTEFTYDALGRLTATTLKGVSGCDTARDPICNTDLITWLTYAGAGPLEMEQSRAGNISSYTYDARGRVKTISRGPTAADQRERIEYSYDVSTGKKASQRLLARENGAWVEKSRESFAYDVLSQLESVTHADATSVEYSYDEEGRVAAMRDENHTAPNTSYSYDPAGRVHIVEQALSTASTGSIETHYAYDLHGNLTSVTDPNGNVTSYLFDDFGQMVRQSSPVTGVTTYVYDEAGNLRTSIDARGIATTRTYDALGRLLSSDSAVRGDEDGGEHVAWIYDQGAFASGRLATMSDPSGSTAYTYERRGLLASETRTSDGQSFVTRYFHDGDGNRAAIGYPSGNHVQYTFDYAGRPFSAHLGLTTLVTSTQYLPFGPATEIVYGNGTIRRVTFDGRYFPVTRELASSGGDAIASYAYNHDDAGNVTGIDDPLDTSFNRDFGYDDLNRLTTATTSQGLWGAGSFTYDAMGNLKSTTLGSQTTNFTYRGTTPKLASFAENGDSRAVTYDATGNERVVGSQTYDYTTRNHLRGHDDVTFSYDGRGARTSSRRPVRLTSFTCTPCTLTGGASSILTVTTSSPAPAGGAVVALSSSSMTAPVPASVTIAQGLRSASINVPTQAVSGEENVSVQASFNGSLETLMLRVTGSRFDEFSISPQSVIGGENATATLALRAPAPEEGLRVTLTSSDEAVTVPSSLSVRGGQESVTFLVTTSAVTERTEVTIRASVEGDGGETSLIVLPPSIASVAFAAPGIPGGVANNGTVTLTGIAPAGGATIALQSESRLLEVPPLVLVPAGAKSATFDVLATPVERPVDANVIAFLGGASVAATVRIEPPSLSSMAVGSPVIGGDPLAIDVTINAPAAASGAEISFSSTDTSLVAPPASVVVPSGSSTATVTSTTQPVAADTPVVISAMRNDVTRSATVVITPPPVTLASFSVVPSAIVGSNEVIGSVTLTAPAPSSGIEIELASSDVAAVRVPPVVVVPAGMAQATFAVETLVVAASQTVALTASHAVTEKTAWFVLHPPAGNYVSALDVTPAHIVNGTTAEGVVRLAFPAAAGGADVTLTSDAPSLLSTPSQVKVHTNATSASFNITASPVTQPRSVAITAKYGDVVQRQRVIVAPANAVTLASFAITPHRVVGGSDTMGVITLTAPAPFGGSTVEIAPRRRNMVVVPRTVVVPEGAASVTFAVATEVLHGKKERAVEIETTYNGVSATATVIIMPATATVASRREPFARCASIALQPCLTRHAAMAVTSTTTLYEQQQYFYTPEFSLLAESANSSSATGAPIAYEYIWFAGEPLAQVDIASSAIHYYFNDHLGTPIMQTDANTRVVWHVEYEPYGRIHLARRGETKHQPLRFPGQMTASDSDITYNIFRWYRSSWGRYSSADPLLTSAMDFTHFPIETNPATQPYSYAAGNPIQYVDPLGLYVAPGPIIDACVKTKNPYIIAGGVTVALLIVAANSYEDVKPNTAPKPYKGPCNECKDDDDDDDCDAQLADEQARCFNWWGGSKKNYSKLKACNQSAMWRWFECKNGGVPHTPLSPTPFQY